MARDMAQRATKSRVDDNLHCGKVLASRSLIYNKNYRVDGTAINKLLQEMSLVPNTVRSINVYSKTTLNAVILECLL